MTIATRDTVEWIYEQARKLPPESLADLEKYVEFLKFRDNRASVKQELTDENLLVRLEGILAGYDVSPEALAEARCEMWRNTDNLKL